MRAGNNFTSAILTAARFEQIVNWRRLYYVVTIRFNHKPRAEVVIMKVVWIAFICGFALGGIFGITLMCLFTICDGAKPSNRN